MPPSRSSRRVRALVAGFGLLVVVAVYWRLQPPSSSAFERRVDSSTAVSGVGMACPAGAWRKADADTLRHSLLSLSHVFITHSESLPRIVPLSILDWTVEISPNKRSRAEAMRKAAELSARWSKTPSQFSGAQSEDTITQRNNGRLGVFPASELTIWPSLLDCLSPLKEGEISPPVQTEFGIHVFRVDPMPTREVFSARRLVVGYAGAGFLKYVARSPEAYQRARVRSREAAWNLAQQLVERAKREDFGELIERYSDHRDAGQSGDIGVWSSHEPTVFPRLIDSILATPLGSISPPVDSELGFQIFLRTEVVERPRFAMRARRFAFEPDQRPESPGSQHVSYELARAQLAQWRSHLLGPSTIDELAGIGEVETWSQARGPFGIEKALRATPIGSTVPAPLLSDYTYVIAVRVEARPNQSVQKVTIGLPSAANESGANGNGT